MTKSLSLPDELFDLATKALETAVHHTFLRMLGVEVTVGNIVHTAPRDENGRTIAGVIRWTGDWQGTGIFSCRPECACRLADLMLGTENSTLNEDAFDAVAELTNVIFGSVKAELEAVTNAVSLSLPTIVQGPADLVQASDCYLSVLPIFLEQHCSHVQISFAKITENPLPVFLISEAIVAETSTPILL